MQCVSCGEELNPRRKVCENCGTPVSKSKEGAAAAVPSAEAPKPAACTACGGGPVVEGICAVCGADLSRAHRDHWTRMADRNVGLASDIGSRDNHWRNEDYGHVEIRVIGGKKYILLVVSDGVSSSANPDDASKAGTEAGSAAVWVGLESGSTMKDAIAAAIPAAQAAACAVKETEWGQPHAKSHASATIVFVLICESDMVVSWVGDSRCYVFQDNNGVLEGEMITRDDSWVNDQLAEGTMSLEEALEHPYAHVITQCLGRLPDGVQLQQHILPRKLGAAVRFVLVCSDGFWNGTHTRQDRKPQQIANLIATAGGRLDAVGLAEYLVREALKLDDHDNTTVAVAKFS